jgi:hypothetical protein
MAAKFVLSNGNEKEVYYEIQLKALKDQYKDCEL